MCLLLLLSGTLVFYICYSCPSYFQHYESISNREEELRSL